MCVRVLWHLAAKDRSYGRYRRVPTENGGLHLPIGTTRRAAEKSGVGNRKGEAFWIVRFEHPFLCLGNDADARQLLEVTRHHTLPGACTKFGLTQLLGRITIVRDL